MDEIELKLKTNASPIIWFHCASLGEFEQGRPVMEKIKNLYPEYKILLSFFSPSGYEIQKNYPGADYIFYLPLDSKERAKRFLTITKPALIFFIKYEFWYYYLTEANKSKIPVLLISGIFRKDQPFFQWYGGLHKKMLNCFNHLFVQNEASLALLNSINIYNTSVSGDTRFDRVLEIAGRFQPIPLIEKFCDNRQVLVAGSNWTEDDEALDHFINTHPDMRCIIAPHDITKGRLEECKKLYKHSILFSEYAQDNHCQSSFINTLIIDNIGMLSRLYKYATVCYIGGAFGSEGVHNVLEAAVYSKPVIFGPVYDKYAEAVDLVEAGGAISCRYSLEVENKLHQLFTDPAFYANTANTAGEFVKTKSGATEKIIDYVERNLLLIN